LANQIITNQIIAREFIRISRNTNAFLKALNTQYDSSFARSGAKVGQSIRIRLPVDYALRTGPTAIVQDSVQKSVNLTVATQTGVDMGFSSVDRTMSIDRFNENFIEPAVNRVVGGLASAGMAMMEGGINGSGGVPNWSANQDPATGALLAPVMKTWLDGKASLHNNAVPTTDFKAVIAPNSESTVVSSLAGYFNSQATIAKQYDNGEMMHALGFDWMTDQTVTVHTTGAYAVNPTWTVGKGFAATTVAGANQTGNSLVVSALAGPLKAGDIIAVDGVFGVNTINKMTTGRLRHFNVTANVAAGSTVIPIYPAISGPDGLGNEVAYQTVTASPANAAQVYVTAAPGSMYRKNIVFVPKAMTFATVDLEMPPNVECAREVFDNVSVRVVTQYFGMSDNIVTRLDVLSGFALLKPEWCAVVPDPIY